MLNRLPVLFRKKLSLGCASACLIFIAGCSSTSFNSAFSEYTQIEVIDDIETGLLALHKAAEKEPQDIEQIIKELHKEQESQLVAANKQQQIDAFHQSIVSGQINIWSYYDDACILGDSRAEPFSYLDLLPDDRVYAKKNQRVADAYDAIDSIVYKNPSLLIFTYGINSVKNDLDAALQFGQDYQEIAHEYATRLPNAELCFCSIMPVTDEALAMQPTFQGVSSYNEEIKRICEEDGYTFINCDSLAEASQEYYEPDGIHFISDFYPIWAEYIIEVLRFEAH